MHIGPIARIVLLQPPLMYIIDKQPLVSGDNTCGIFLPGCGNTTAHDWTIGDFPGTKPPVIPPSLPDVRRSAFSFTNFSTVPIG